MQIWNDFKKALIPIYKSNQETIWRFHQRILDAAGRSDVEVNSGKEGLVCWVSTKVIRVVMQEHIIIIQYFHHLWQIEVDRAEKWMMQRKTNLTIFGLRR